MMGGKMSSLPAPGEALPGRNTPMKVSPTHAALDPAPTVPPFPVGSELAIFALGCFWGAERLFWRTTGVISTQVGYSGGETPHPTYEEVCSGGTGHTEVVRVVYDPHTVNYGRLLQIFFEAHDPTQGMRQGNDRGTQYRSAVYATSDEQLKLAQQVAAAYQIKLNEKGLDKITTEIRPAGEFYYAEDYHQQYLHKVPNGYCGLRGTGAACPLPKKDEL